MLDFGTLWKVPSAHFIFQSKMYDFFNAIVISISCCLYAARKCIFLAKLLISFLNRHYFPIGHHCKVRPNLEPLFSLLKMGKMYNPRALVNLRCHFATFGMRGHVVVQTLMFFVIGELNQLFHKLI